MKDSGDGERHVPEQHMQAHHIPVLELYGTEYGFCKEIAERLGEALRSCSSYW